MLSRKEEYLKQNMERIRNEYPGVELDIGKRWEEGVEHHPKSKEIYGILEDLDLFLGEDRFCFKSGGDGDNGEHIMYLLDIHFESEDKKATLHD